MATSIKRFVVCEPSKLHPVVTVLVDCSLEGKVPEGIPVVVACKNNLVAKSQSPSRLSEI
jgi:hypothetical protein